MKRNYTDGSAENIKFFTGYEVEHTPAYGMHTLFVVGVQLVKDIEDCLAISTYETSHIFFGANHSYDPYGYEQHEEWESMIKYFLDKDYLCSLDIPMSQVEEFNESCLCEYNNFIPQIRVPIPYTKLWNYNTTIKIDDKDFNATNPGVWSHSLHTLMDKNAFTSWTAYKNDNIIK
jgi:hypothetical protein